MKSTFPRAASVFAFLILVLSACKKQQDVPASGIQSESSQEDAVVIPKPAHIVIVVLENHGYPEIMGSTSAPYINSISRDTFTANFRNSFGVEHPSQPNYLDLFSGTNQGVTDDNRPSKEPFTTPNLARQLINKGYSYATYSQGLPSVGYNGDSYGAYVRKHNPAANWMGTGTNQIPTTTNQPFTAFPTDFTKLPTVSIVVPDENNDMHDGSISQGDTWIKNNLSKYVQWAKTHNSLFILTFDEDDYSADNKVVTMFTGSMVKGGRYGMNINHYNVLRTIERMYRLGFVANASNVKTIRACWR
jgi:hypothetical protein